MKKSSESDVLAERPSLDFSKAVRGKYAARLREYGSNVVLIDQDLIESFPDSVAVNDALRSLQRIANRSVSPPSRRRAASA